MTLIVISPWRIAKIVSLGVALGHVIGSNAWLWIEIGLYWLYPPMLLFSAWLIVWTWERADARCYANKATRRLGVDMADRQPEPSR